MRNIETHSKKGKLFHVTEPNKHRDISVSLEDKVAFLKNTQTYPEKSNKVEVIETHMSWVFLTKEFVYKLKKPVKSELLDYSTLKKREKNCHTEVLLNNRLAPNVYLAVAPITVDSSGKLRLQGDGEAIDWLVKMRRLPHDRMLDYAIQNHTVNEKCILATREDLLLPQHQPNKSLIISITTNQLDFLMKHSKYFAQRAKDNKIVEAHGDLRPEHICLLKEPVIIDCLEFSRELRILDPVDELSFLALECERLGSPFAGRLVLEIYSKTANDFPPVKLVHFYKSYRACVRAKLAIWHLRDDQVLDHAKWIQRSNDYLNLANKYAHNLQLTE